MHQWVELGFSLEIRFKCCLWCDIVSLQQGCSKWGLGPKLERSGGSTEPYDDLSDVSRAKSQSAILL